jgi:zona occludens toxin
MAITAIVGRPGHGKSYSATEIAILPALKEGRAIYTNIPLRDEAIYQDYPGAKINYCQLAPDEINDPDFWLFEPGALVILDELWRVWPSGLKANKVPVPQLAFIKEHRHRTDDQGRWQDIVLVTQNLGDIAAAIREMVETTVICMQLQDMGAAGWFIREYYTGPIKGCDSGPSEKMVNNERIKYQDSVYRYYVSNTQGTNKLAGPQGAKVVKQTIWQGWKTKGAVLLLLIFLIALPLTLKKTSDGIERTKQQANASNNMAKPPEPVMQPPTPPKPQLFSPPTPVQPEPEQPPASPKQPEPSKQWRLTGRYKANGPAMVLISDGTMTRRLPESRYCKKLDGELVCTIGDQVIASWTGSRPTEKAPFEPLATINTDQVKP